MREGQFIKRNLKRWEQYQQPTEDPDEVAKRFTYLVDDLSYAKTFYPFGKTKKYINSIAANIYLSIYKNKKEKKRKDKKKKEKKKKSKKSKSSKRKHESAEDSEVRTFSC